MFSTFNSFQSNMHKKPKSLVITGGGSGGTLSKNGNYFNNTFLSSGTFTITQTTTVNYLIVAGGGGSGYTDGTINSAGGAGGYKLGSITLNSGSYVVTVGNGGYQQGGYSGSGDNSIFNDIIATGGGAGGGQSDNSYPGRDGGSGGGGNTFNATMTPRPFGLGITGQGNNGGVTFTKLNTTTNGTSILSTGGGGGATSVGITPTLNIPANGGTGITISSSNLSGYPNSTTFCGGGGGLYYIYETGISTVTSGGAGGSGGGGAGGFNGVSSKSGTANTGGGGGGGYGMTSKGGSGIVILTYTYSTFTPTSGTFTSNTLVNYGNYDGGKNGTHIVSSSSQRSGYSDFNAFNSFIDTDKRWSSTPGTFGGDGNRTAMTTTPSVISGVTYYAEWIQIQLPSKITLSSYGIMNVSDYHGINEFYLGGSNDGSTFTLLDSQNLMTLTLAPSVQQFNISTNLSYNYYRLYITKIISSYVGYANLIQLQLNGTTYDVIPDILWYKFNSTDLSSNGLNLLNSTTGDYNALCTTSNMIVNNALNLDAINSIDLKLTNNTTITSFTTTQSVSYTCWIYVTNLNTQANPSYMWSIPITMAYNQQYWNILPFEFQYSNSTSFIWQRSNIGGDCLTINNPPSINYNTYAHYAFIVENTGTSLWTFKRYVNNILIDTLLSTATNNPSLIPFSFANYPSKINSTFDSSSQYFKNTTGALDDFRVYNYALTSSQVTSIYNSRN